MFNDDWVATVVEETVEAAHAAAQPVLRDSGLTDEQLTRALANIEAYFRRLRDDMNSDGEPTFRSIVSGGP